MIAIDQQSPSVAAAAHSPGNRGSACRGLGAQCHYDSGSATAPGSCPGGTCDNSPTFQRWVRGWRGESPEGTAEQRPPQPSLRDLDVFGHGPSVETLGY